MDPAIIDYRLQLTDWFKQSPIADFLLPPSSDSIVDCGKQTEVSSLLLIPSILQNRHTIKQIGREPDTQKRTDRQIQIDRKKDKHKQAGRHTDTNRQTQADMQASRQAGKRKDGQTDRQKGRRIDKQRDRQKRETEKYTEKEFILL